ncbi:hypothetical protein [Nocardia brasiliensis]
MWPRLTRGWIAAGVIGLAAVVIAVWIWWPWQRSHGEALSGWEAQVELPMPVSGPSGIAVSPSGDIYVSESEGIQKLAAGRYTPEHISTPNLHWPSGFALGPRGDLFICDYYQNGRVVKMTSDTNDLVPLPFTGLGAADLGRIDRVQQAGVAVDRMGTVYVTDPDNARVLKLPAGSDTQVVVVTVEHLGPPIALSDTGELVVTRTAPGNQLLRIPPGSTTPIETALPVVTPSSALTVDPVSAMAFDHNGDLLFADIVWLPDPYGKTGETIRDGRLWRIPAGSTTPVRLPYNELGAISGIAVDPNGDILISDSSVSGGRAMRLIPRG